MSPFRVVQLEQCRCDAVADVLIDEWSADCSDAVELATLFCSDAEVDGNDKTKSKQNRIKLQ